MNALDSLTLADREQGAHPYGFCHRCGARYASDAWPRLCHTCGCVTWRNPLPVAVLLLPVRVGNAIGVLTVRRGIVPKWGALALPGGFIEWGERWQDACAREAREEAGVVVDPDTITIIAAEAGDDGTLILCGQAPVMEAGALPPFVPSEEATERIVLLTAQELAFPLHTRLLAHLLAQGGT